MKFRSLVAIAAVFVLCAIYSHAVKSQETVLVAHPDTEPKADKPVEVVFVLDTTGSMSGLIEGAKQKIWSMAHTVLSLNQSADVKFGLIGYKDRGDVYITKVFDLTNDIDFIYAELQKFTAQGGGDFPESVNQALYEAVELITWSPVERDVYRAIFLVGDAPPHMDYPDDVKYPETCRRARENGIIINTVQCGAHQQTERYWREIAELGGGDYARIQQSGGMRVIETPYDKEIKDFTDLLVATAIPYGDHARQAMYASRAEGIRGMSATSNASRQMFMETRAYRAPTAGIRLPAGDGVVPATPMAPRAVEALRDTAVLSMPETEGAIAAFSSLDASEPLARGRIARTIEGGADLTAVAQSVGDDEDKRKALDEQLANEDRLPENMRAMSLEDRKQYVDEQIAKRRELNVKIAELNQKRVEWLREDENRRRAAGTIATEDAFDVAASAIMARQLNVK